MAGRLPKRLFRVVAVDNKRGKLPWYKAASRTFAQEAAAKAHIADLARKDVRAELYECEPNWVLVSPAPPLEGEEELPYEDN